ncbi:MAG: DUF6651 domain-containing protein [Steroidobacteraceae bacterium]
MKLKLDEAGHVVVKDGMPVYVHDDGKEIPFDAAGTVATISRLNGEAKGHRERAEKVERSLKAFEGIEDAEAARKALTVVKNLDAKKLVDAGEVDRVRQEAVKAVEDKYAPILKERDALSQQLVEEKVGGSFARSKFIGEKLAIPADLVQARFGNLFKLEDGRVVGYDSSGNKLFSRAKPGELAVFDEAIEMLVEQYPYRASILKSSGASGGGANGGGNGGGAGGKQLTRTAFEQLSPEARTAHFKGGGTIVDAA